MPRIKFTYPKFIMFLLVFSVILYFLYYLEIGFYYGGYNKNIFFHRVNRTKKLLTLSEVNRGQCNDSFDEKMWFFTGGVLRPTRADFDPLKGRDNVHLFPDKWDRDDRIVAQLNYVPSNYDVDKSPTKTILLVNGIRTFGGDVHVGRKNFDECPVSSCIISEHPSAAATADAVLFKKYIPIKGPRPKNQIWIGYQLESPFHSKTGWSSNVYNWTATYRRDSELVAPYEKWVYYNDNCRQKQQGVNFVARKTKKVAWFVSNCRGKNKRYDYAMELQKYIEVDIYGTCSTLKCSKSNKKQCFEKLEHDYKFYLSFENSNCRDYVTEKFFVNALSHKVVPIVMGARPEDYSRSAPFQSYIHVDDFESPKDLADYLHFLDTHDELYNAYFRWHGTGEFINTRFWCRLCALLHSNNIVPKRYTDLEKWWNGDGICTNNWNWN